MSNDFSLTKEWNPLIIHPAGTEADSLQGGKSPPFKTPFSGHKEDCFLTFTPARVLKTVHAQNLY
jgi:hypothetical protein